MRRDGKDMQEQNSNILPKTKTWLQGMSWKNLSWDKFETRVERIQMSIYYDNVIKLDKIRQNYFGFNGLFFILY